MDTKHWLTLADRVRAEGAYSYADFARDMASQLTWLGALDAATALRSFVYGQPGGSDLHKAVEPIYRRLGWQQSALVACWFRDARNRPGRRPGGWPTSTPKTEETPVTSHVEQQVQARIEQARAKVAAARERRDDLAAARRRGLAHRHARKLRNLAEQEQRQQDAEGPDDEPVSGMADTDH